MALSESSARVPDQTSVFRYEWLGVALVPLRVLIKGNHKRETFLLDQLGNICCRSLVIGCFSPFAWISESTRAFICSESTEFRGRLREHVAVLNSESYPCVRTRNSAW